jgi:hypothetical protein
MGLMKTRLCALYEIFSAQSRRLFFRSLTALESFLECIEDIETDLPQWMMNMYLIPYLIYFLQSLDYN